MAQPEYKFKGSYRDNYYRGLKGLSAFDREEWEKEYAEQLKLFPKSAEDDIFRTSVLKDMMEKDPNQEYVQQLREKYDINTAEGQHAIFDHLMLTRSASPLKEEQSSTDRAIASSLTEYSAEQYKNAGLFKLFGMEGTASLYEHEARDSRQAAADLTATDIAKLSNMGKDNQSSYVIARQHLVGQQDDTEGIQRELNFLNQNMEAGAISDAELDDQLAQMSSLYAIYGRGQDPNVSLTAEERKQIFAEYLHYSKSISPEYGITRVNDLIQNIMAERQSVWDKTVKGFESFGESFIGGAATFVGGIWGLLSVLPVAAVKGIDMLINSEEYKHLSILDQLALATSQLWDNGLTQWGEGLVSTGVWGREKQQQYLKEGRHDNRIFNSVEQDEMLLSGNTVFELGGAVGFTTQAILTSVAGGAVIQGAGKLAKGAVLANKMKDSISKIRTITKATNKVLAAMPALTAAGEAAMMAVGGKNNNILKGQQFIDSTINSEIDEAIVNEVSNNPAVAEQKVREALKRMGVNEKEVPIVLGKVNSKGVKYYDEEDIQKMISILSKDQTYRQTIEQQEGLDEKRAAAEQKLIGLAARQGALTYGVNMAILTPINRTMQLGQQSASVQKAVRQQAIKNAAARATEQLAERVTIESVEEGGEKGLKAFAKQIGRSYTSGQKFKEAIAEGWEEYSQGLEDKRSEAYTLGYLDYYMKNMYDPSNNKAFLDTVADAVAGTWHGASKAAGEVVEAAFSKELIREACYGALGTLMPTPMINTNVRWTKKQQGQSTWEYMSQLSPIHFRSALFDIAIGTEARQQTKNNELLAEYLNTIFETEEFKQVLNSSAAATNFLKEYHEAVEKGDEKLIHDAKFRNLAYAVGTLYHTQNTEYSKAVIEQLEQRKKLDSKKVHVEDSDEQKVLQEYCQTNAIDPETLSEKDKEEVIERVKESASEMSDFLDVTYTKMGEYEEVFSENLDIESKNIMLYNDLFEKKAEKRVQGMQSSIEDVAEKTEEKTSEGSESTKLLQAEFGSVEAARTRVNGVVGADGKVKTKGLKHAIAETQIRIKKAQAEEKGKETTPKTDFYEAYLDKLTEERDRINSLLVESAKDNLDESTKQVISARDILRMSPKARAAIFDRYKKDTKSLQGQEIAKAKQLALTMGITNLAQQIQDAAKLTEDIENAQNNRLLWYTNPQILQQKVASARDKAHIKQLSKKYDRFSDTNSTTNASYESFRDEATSVLNKIVAKEKKEVSELRALLSQLRKSQHWEQYNKERQVHFNTLQTIYSYLDSQEELKTEEAQNIKRNIEALGTILLKKGVILTPKTTVAEFESALQPIMNDIIESLPEILYERNKNATPVSDLQVLIDWYSAALNNMNEVVSKEEKINPDQGKPVEVKEVTPEKNTPKEVTIESYEEKTEEPISIENITLSTEAIPAIAKISGPIRNFLIKHNLLSPNRFAIVQKLKQQLSKKENPYVYFYFPAEISDEIVVYEKGHPVKYPVAVAIVQDKNGEIRLGSKRYTAIDTIVDPKLIKQIVGADGIVTTTEDGKTKTSIKTDTILGIAYQATKINVARSNDKQGKKTNIKVLLQKENMSEKDFLDRVEVGRSKDAKSAQLVFKHDAGQDSRTSDIFIADSADVIINEETKDGTQVQQTVFDVLNQFLSNEITAEQAILALDYLKYTKNNETVSRLNNLLSSVSEALRTSVYDEGKLSNAKEVLSKINTTLNAAFHNLYTLGTSTTFKVTNVKRDENKNITFTLSLGETSIPNVTLDSLKGAFVSTIASESLEQGQAKKTISMTDKEGRSFLQINVNYKDVEEYHTSTNNTTKFILGQKLSKLINMGVLTTTAQSIKLTPDNIMLTPVNAPGIVASRTEEKIAEDTTNPSIEQTETAEGNTVDAITGIASEEKNEAQQLLDRVEQQLKEDIQQAQEEPRLSSEQPSQPSFKQLQDVTAEEVEEDIDNMDLFGDDVLFQYNKREKLLSDLAFRLRQNIKSVHKYASDYDAIVAFVKKTTKLYQGNKEANENPIDAKQNLENELWERFAAYEAYISNIKVTVNEKTGYMSVKVSFYTLEEAIDNKLKEYYRTHSLASLQAEKERFDAIEEYLANEPESRELYHLGKKQREEAKESITKNNPQITQKDLDTALDFLHTLENTPELNLYVKTVLAWIKNNTVDVINEHEVLLDLFNSARTYKVNIQQCKTPYLARKKIVETILAQDIVQEKMLPVDISKYEEEGTLSLVEIKTLPSGEQISIYDVVNNDVGQQAVCQIIADSLPKGRDGKPVIGSPWCLAVFNYDTKTKQAKVTNSAKEMWYNRYNKGRRQIAMYKGFPYAFNSSEFKHDEWWSMQDKSQRSIDNIPFSEFTRKKQTYEDTVTNSDPVLTYAGTMFIQGHVASYHIYNRAETNKFIAVSREETPHISLNILPNQLYYTMSSVEEGTGITVKINKAKDGTYTLTYCEDNTYKITKITDQNHIQYADNLLSQAKNIYNSGQLGDVFNSFESFYKQINDNSTETPIEYTNTQEKVEEKEANHEQVKEEDKEYVEAVQNAENVKALDNIINEAIQEAVDNVNNRGAYIGIKGNVTEVKINNLIGENATEKEKQETKAAIDYLEQKTIRDIYNEHVEKPALSELSKILRQILAQYNVQTIEGPLKEYFGEDVLGAYDFINKVVYLAEEKDRNAITEPEEFAHAFITLMGNLYKQSKLSRRIRPTSKLYSELVDLARQTSLYQQVQQEYAGKYKTIEQFDEETVGKALAAMLVDRYENKTEADNTFFTKLKQWFSDVLFQIKSIISKKADVKLQAKLIKIADSILDGTYNKKYLEKYVKKQQQKNILLVDPIYALESVPEQRRNTIIQTVKFMNNLGGLLSGSLALCAQGTIYRSEQSQIHDLDFAFGPSVHKVFTKYPELKSIRTSWKNTAENQAEIIELLYNTDLIQKIKQKFPSYTITRLIPSSVGICVNGVINKGEKSQVDIDLFINYNEQKASEDKLKDTEISEVNLHHHSHIWHAKLALMNRAKDLYDYQNFNPTSRKYISNSIADALLQVANTKSQTESREEKNKKDLAKQYAKSANTFMYNWENMNVETLEKLEKAKMTQEMWERMTNEEREKVIHCTL